MTIDHGSKSKSKGAGKPNDNMSHLVLGKNHADPPWTHDEFRYVLSHIHLWEQHPLAIEPLCLVRQLVGQHLSSTVTSTAIRSAADATNLGRLEDPFTKLYQSHRHPKKYPKK